MGVIYLTPHLIRPLVLVKKVRIGFGSVRTNTQKSMLRIGAVL